VSEKQSSLVGGSSAKRFADRFISVSPNALFPRNASSHRILRLPFYSFVSLPPPLARFVEQASPALSRRGVFMQMRCSVLSFFLCSFSCVIIKILWSLSFTHARTKLRATKLRIVNARTKRAYSRVRCTFRMLMANTSRMQFRVAQDIATWQRCTL